MAARTNVCLLLFCCSLSLVCSACGSSAGVAATPLPTWTSTSAPIASVSSTPSPTSSATATPPSPTSSATATPSPIAATSTAVPPTSTVAQATPLVIRPASPAPIVTAGQPGACTPAARLLADLTIPAGTTLAPQTEFTKIWRIRNAGACAWGAGYRFVYAAGDQLGGAAAAIPAVAPGQTVDISIDLVAPSAPGSYGSLWRLQAGNGTTFGRYTVFINVEN